MRNRILFLAAMVVVSVSLPAVAGEFEMVSADGNTVIRVSAPHATPFQLNRLMGRATALQLAGACADVWAQGGYCNLATMSGPLRDSLSAGGGGGYYGGYGWLGPQQTVHSGTVYLLPPTGIDPRVMGTIQGQQFLGLYQEEVEALRQRAQVEALGTVTVELVAGQRRQAQEIDTLEGRADANQRSAAAAHQRTTNLEGAVAEANRNGARLDLMLAEGQADLREQHHDYETRMQDAEDILIRADRAVRRADASRRGSP